MKKVLAWMLSLAMLLTMASFPVFATDATLIELTADNVIASGGGRYPGSNKDFGDVDAMFDGVMGATRPNMFVNAYTVASGNTIADATNATNRTFIIDLGADYDLSTMNIYWGGMGIWGIVSPDSYTIYTAPSAEEGADPVYTEFVTYSDMMTAVRAGTVNSTLASYPNVTVLKTGTPYESYNATEDMTGVTARYIKIEINRFHQRVGIREIEVYGNVATGGDKVATSYTVKYLDTEGNPVATEKNVTDGAYVGNRVLEDAVDVEGYSVDAQSKALVLTADAAANVITFTYTKKTATSYTVNYLDEEGTPLISAKTVTTGAYVGDTAIEAAASIEGYVPDEKSKSLELTADANANVITFTYSVDKTLTPASVTATKTTVGTVASIWDGDTATYHQAKVDGGDGTAEIISYTFNFGETYNFSKISSLWGYYRMTSGYVYVSEDGETWGDHVLAFDNVSYTNETAGGSAAYRANWELPAGTQGKHIKIAVTKASYTGENYITVREVSIEGERPAGVPTTYTIKQVDKDGNTVATDMVLSGNVGETLEIPAPEVTDYTVVSAATQSLTLSANAEKNVVTFVYGLTADLVATTYRVRAYIGNEMYLSIVDYDGYIGYSVTATAPTFDGYTLVGDAEVTIESLVAQTSSKDKNVITFNYVDDVEDVEGAVTILPYSAEIKDADGNDMAASGTYTIDKTIDNKTSTYFKSSGNVTGDGTTAVATVILDLGHSYKLTELDFILGSSYVTKGTVSVASSLDGEWTKVHDISITSSDITKILNSSAYDAGNLVAQSISTEVYGRYVKLEITQLLWGGNPVTIRELAFKGIFAENDAPIALTGENLLEIFPLSINSMDKSCLFDGKWVYDLENVVLDASYNSGVVTLADPYVIEIDLGAYYDLSELVIFGGGISWGYNAPVQYNVYVAGADKYYTTAAYNSPVDSSANPNKRRDIIDLTGVEDTVRYIKIEIAQKYYRVALTEIQVFGTATAKPEGTVNSLGGQIRLASGEIPAGLRFGAIIGKDLYNITGEYAYSDTATVKFGMVLLPQSMLGEYATVDALIAANGENAGLVLDIPATRVYRQDEYAVAYTAVIKSIPEDAFSTEICAVPYAEVDGVRTYFTQMVKSYAGVAKSAHDSYSAGNPNGLTQADVEALEAILSTAGVAYTPIDFSSAE